MIDFSSETYRSILDRMLSRVPDSYDKRDTSPIPTALGPAAYVAEAVFLALDYEQKQAFIRTASGSSLDELAVVARTSRYQASAAVRLGVFNAPVPLGSRFSTLAGEGSINFAVTAVLDDTHCQLTAETPGLVGNDYTGPILPITTIPGLTSAQLTDILVPGDDREDDETFRARLIEALDSHAFGGNIADYLERIGAMDGVGAVQVWPTWQGGGTVKCSILGADLAPAPDELLTRVQNAVDPPPNQGLGLGTAPIGAKVTIATAQTVAVSVSATVLLEPGYSLGQVQQPAEDALSSYLLEVRRHWADNVSTTGVDYRADVYLAQIIAALVQTPGILNVNAVQLNADSADLKLPQTSALQQVPVLGEVTLDV